MDATTYRRHRGLLIAWRDRPNRMREKPQVTVVEWVKVEPTLFEGIEQQKVMSRNVSNNYRRAMLPTFGQLRGKGVLLAHRGICRWCKLPIAEKRRSLWHEDCVPAYWAATGNQSGLVGYFFRQHCAVHDADPWCEQCGPGSNGVVELDHRDALSVAWASGDERRMLRALTLNNLRWLCHDCHKVKTGDDRRLMNELLEQVAEHTYWTRDWRVT